MKSEKEVLKLYEEMLEHTKKLSEIVQNPPDLSGIEQIKEAINDENSQHSMNALIEWVLELKTEI